MGKDSGYRKERKPRKGWNSVKAETFTETHAKQGLANNNFSYEL